MSHVCVKAKQTLVSFFLLFSCTFPLAVNLAAVGTAWYLVLHGSIYNMFKLSYAIFFLRASGISFRWGSKKQIYPPLFVQAERGP